MVGFCTSPRFVEHDTGPHHPERPDRIRAIFQAVREAGMASSPNPLEPVLPSFGIARRSQTLIELERAPMVTDNRNAFQTAMQDRFIAAVEELSGRNVVHFISSHNVGPDLEVELFFLADAP